MKNAILAALALGTLSWSVGGYAQSANNNGNSAVKGTHTLNTDGASRGANSFTEGQARGHIENAGFTGVSKLTRDPNGVWRGTAVKNGHRVPIAVDFKGDVSTRRE